MLDSEKCLTHIVTCHNVLFCMIIMARENTLRVSDYIDFEDAVTRLCEMYPRLVETKAQTVGGIYIDVPYPRKESNNE